jgi:UDP-glucose 4-epimerase
MKKVVVFGGSGFLGSYVADELTRRGYDVLIADLKDPLSLIAGQTFIEADIMDPVTIGKVVGKADVVYNFAGLADIDESIHQPKRTMEQNVIGNINILNACKDLKLGRYVYASSAYAFSNKGSFYGISKLASEKIIEEYSARFDLPYTIIRYGSLYGERADSHNGMYRLLREAIETRAIKHRGNGEEMREYTHAFDAAKLSVDIIEDDQFVNGHTILTGVERLRKRDLFRMVQEILNDEISVTFTDEPWEGHYEVTPYSYHPNVARKLVSNSFIDLGQGLVSCIQKIHDEIETDS